LNTVTLETVAERLLEHRDVVLSAHVSPDPDAIGSTCALALALKRLGKNVRVYFADVLPQRMKNLVTSIEITCELPVEPFSALVICDTAAKKRVSGDVEALWKLADHTFNIDHHVSNNGWAETNYIDSEAAATAVIVTELLHLLRVPLCPELGNMLLAGLMDDTGCFCFSNSTKRAFECAGSLVAAGAKPDFVANELYFTTPLAALRLRAIAIDSLEVLLEGKVAYITVTLEQMEQVGARVEDAEGLVDIARQVAGTEVVAMQRQIEGGWKMSLRSKKRSIDVNRIAGVFGGGGHHAAAGCKIEGSAEEVKARVVEEITKELKREGDSSVA